MSTPTFDVKAWKVKILAFIKSGRITIHDHEPFDILRHWVKISIPQTTPGTTGSDPGDEEHTSEEEADPLLWFGRITDVARDLGAKVKSQTFTVVGMECLLEHPLR